MHLSFRHFIVLLLVFSSNCSNGKNREITVAFWNVENLFDLENDPLTNDDEFAMGGQKSHTQKILDLKIEHLKEVIDEIDADIFGFCEVENRFVCELLNTVSLLKSEIMNEITKAKKLTTTKNNCKNEKDRILLSN